MSIRNKIDWKKVWKEAVILYRKLGKDYKYVSWRLQRKQIEHCVDEQLNV